MTEQDGSIGAITCSHDWREPEMAARSDWLKPVTYAHMEEVRAALARIKAEGLALGTFGKEEFPLHTLAEDLAWVQAQLQTGPGFAILRGFPVTELTDPEMRSLYWGVGWHLGTPLAQSRHGDVRDIGGTIREDHGRDYIGRVELSYHSDGCDIAGLFCINVAKKDGFSQLVSAAATHNEIARHLKSHIEWGHRSAGLPMTPEQREAMEIVGVITHDPAVHLETEFQAGGMQFANNFKVFHARTEFGDREEPAQKWHLLRMWLAVPNSPPSPESFKPYCRETGAGTVRGGNQAWRGTTFETTEAV